MIMQVPASILEKKISFWMRNGLVRSEGGGVYILDEEGLAVATDGTQVLSAVLLLIPTRTLIVMKIVLYSITTQRGVSLNRRLVPTVTNIVFIRCCKIFYHCRTCCKADQNDEDESDDDSDDDEDDAVFMFVMGMLQNNPSLPLVSISSYSTETLLVLPQNVLGLILAVIYDTACLTM